MDTPVYILDASFILLRLSHALPPFRNYFLFDVSTLTCSFAFRIDFLFLYSCLFLYCHSSLNFTYARRVICESESVQENSVLLPHLSLFHSNLARNRVHAIFVYPSFVSFESVPFLLLQNGPTLLLLFSRPLDPRCRMDQFIPDPSFTISTPFDLLRFNYSRWQERIDQVGIQSRFERSSTV